MNSWRSSASCKAPNTPEAPEIRAAHGLRPVESDARQRSVRSDDSRGPLTHQGPEGVDAEGCAKGNVEQLQDPEADDPGPGTRLAAQEHRPRDQLGQRDEREKSGEDGPERQQQREWKLVDRLERRDET